MTAPRTRVPEILPQCQDTVLGERQRAPPARALGRTGEQSGGIWRPLVWHPPAPRKAGTQEGDAQGPLGWPCIHGRGSRRPGSFLTPSARPPGPSAKCLFTRERRLSDTHMGEEVGEHAVILSSREEMGAVSVMFDAGIICRGVKLRNADLSL